MNTTLLWQTVHEGHPGRLALQGDLLAAATLDRLRLWRGGLPVAQAQSPVRAPGWPVPGAQAVHWGPGRWTAAAGYQADGALLALCAQGRRVPACWAWRDDGACVLLSLGGGPGPGADPGPQALLAEPGRGLRAVLRSDAEAAAKACCLGLQVAVVGSAQASVHGADGRLRLRLDNPSPALRLVLCAAGQRLLLVESGRLSLYRLHDGHLLCRAQGHWTDAAPTPDGTQLLAVDVQGRLAWLDAATPDPEPRWIDTSDPVQAVALDDTQVLASFARGAPLRCAPWPPRH
jgi:hypothetical protein